MLLFIWRQCKKKKIEINLKWKWHERKGIPTEIKIDCLLDQAKFNIQPNDFLGTMNIEQVEIRYTNLA